MTIERSQVLEPIGSFDCEISRGRRRGDVTSAQNFRKDFMGMQKCRDDQTVANLTFYNLTYVDICGVIGENEGLGVPSRDYRLWLANIQSL